MPKVLIKQKVYIYGSANEQKTIEWYDMEGEGHRCFDRPAMIVPHGTKIWMKEGQFDRDGCEPAIIDTTTGYEEYWASGKFLESIHTDE